MTSGAIDESRHSGVRPRSVNGFFRQIFFWNSLRFAYFLKPCLQRTFMHRNVPLYAVLTILLFLNSRAFAEREHKEKFADELPSNIASTWFEQLYDVGV